jgi:uncharacterized protein (TIGR00730 family)
MNIRSVAIFCGSQKGTNPIFAEHAKELGRLIAVLGLKMVYGGSSKGLMGIVADAVLAHGGEVMGIIPELLVEREHQHKKLTEMAILPDMHARKKMIYERSDAAIVLPGGLGTLDEFFEILAWNQLKIHDKRIYILNSAGFYNQLLNHLKLLQKEGFLYESLDDRISAYANPVELFNKIG